jgi:hypothetical protein
MSLIVYPYKRAPFTGAMEDLTKDSLSAGFEKWRWQLWGSEAVRSFSCVLLPSLETGDIYAEGADLDQLEAEASLLLQHVDLIATHTGIGAYQIPLQGGPARYMGTLDEDTAASLLAIQQIPQGGGTLLRERLMNILAAVQIAKEQGEGRGGVYIG